MGASRSGSCESLDRHCATRNNDGPHALQAAATTACAWCVERAGSKNSTAVCRMLRNGGHDDTTSRSHISRADRAHLGGAGEEGWHKTGFRLPVHRADLREAGLVSRSPDACAPAASGGLRQLLRSRPGNGRRSPGRRRRHPTQACQRRCGWCGLTYIVGWHGPDRRQHSD